MPPGGVGILEVSSVAQNEFHPLELRRTTTEGGSTTVSSLLLAYDDDSCFDPYLQTVTYRQQMDGGAWSILARRVYTYYDGGDSYGRAGDL